ncbi:serine/threonine-protein kinase [Nocardia goodfellowii]
MSEMPPAPALAPGTIFAGYRIERVLGSGGMGTVYLAAHPRLPRYDALKVLSESHSADPEFRARFGREAELVARLDHPNIVAVRDRGDEHGRLWFAMQFVEGGDAAELLRRYPAGAPAATVLHIVSEAAAGLDAAHRAGLLHRDVKPANILLEPRPGAPDRVYVTDFGIARAAAETTALTEAGTVLATLAYAAPEQIMAQRTDQRVDVYALGCTLYELLTGAKPFPRASAVAVMHAHLYDAPPRASAHNPVLPAALGGVLATALAKNPEQRYPSCGALAAALAAALGANPETTAVLRPPTGPRKPWAVVTAVAAILAVALVAGVIWMNRAPAPADQAGTSSSAPAATPTSTALPAAAVSWSSYRVVIDALPGLLPVNPIGSGYQGMRCVAVDSEMKQIDLNVRPGRILWLSCYGNEDPMEWMLVSCNANLAPTLLSRPTDGTIAGDELWERPSGRGRMVWGNNPDLRTGRPEGMLIIQFDDPARNFCQLSVQGGSSGQELVDRWWRDAPL